MTKVKQRFINSEFGLKNLLWFVNLSFFLFILFPFSGFSDWKWNGESEAASEGRERERKEDLCQNVCVKETAVTSLHTDLPALVS